MVKGNRKINLKRATAGVIGSICAILILTILEFPPPFGFETRPQGDVSIFWLVFFLVILVTEIVVIVFAFKRPKLSAKFAFASGILNILQIIADQMHLMQPETATLAYTLIEYSVGLFALSLIYFAWKVNSTFRSTKTSYRR